MYEGLGVVMTWKPRGWGIALGLLAVALAMGPRGLAHGLPPGDWPMSRYDAARSAWTPHGLEPELHLHWVRELPQPRRAWPWQMDDFEKLAFDAAYEPVAAEGLLFTASMVTDSVTAHAIDTGEEQWRYHTDGPVRLAPLYAERRLYAVSDDGFLHCLDAATGTLHWKFQAGPGNRMVLGNERLISIWAARGGPVIAGDTLYFAAGFWPHEGVFIYALDARTGAVLWRNSGSQSDMIVDSKRYYSFGGVAPQGHMVLQGGHLLVAGGRTAPALYDRHTGELRYFNIASSTTTKAGGGHRVFANDQWFFNVRDKEVTHMYAMATGAPYGEVTVDLIAGDTFIGFDPATRRLVAFDAELTRTTTEEPDAPIYDRRGRPIGDAHMDAIARGASQDELLRSGALSAHYRLEEKWATEPLEGFDRLHVMAGTTLYGCGADGQVFAVESPQTDGSPAKIRWTHAVDGAVHSMLAAHGRLIVSTESGHIYGFGPGDKATTRSQHTYKATNTTDDRWAQHAKFALEATDVRGGYALCFGIGSGRLLEELLVQSELHVTAFDTDPARVAAMRAHFMEAGLYGSRVAIHEGSPTTVQLPPYIASLIVSEDPDGAGLADGAAFVQALYHPLRPYGGLVYLPLDARRQEAFAASVESAGLEKFELVHGEGAVRLSRPGALPGSAVWTHQYADAGNSAFSADQRVKAPLGIAWFGGTPNHKTLPRHMHGPIPQVIDGRLIILGPHHISARCVYTGAELWNQELPQVGALYTDWDYEAQAAPVYFPNHPGANFIGSPYATASDSIYLIHEDACLRIDTMTGAILDTFEMPPIEALRQFDPDPVAGEYLASFGARLQEGQQRKWGNIRYSGETLIAAAYPHMFDDRQPGREDNWNMTSSEFLAGFDRYTGEIRWVHQARYGFRHNAIAASADRVFVIDNLSSEIREILERRGIEPDIAPEVRALDIATGEVLWTHAEEVFGTSLSYSAPQDVLVQSGHPGRRRALPDEPQDRLHALSGTTGETLWAGFFPHRRSPLGMHTSWGRIIGSTGEMALDMRTGEAMTRLHPVTGQEEEWSWVGALRCGTQNYSEHLILFRSGVAGFTDLAGGAATGNITGYRPGCTNNMVVADGILNSPDYSRSCSCSYQLQTSLGLVHMPENELWTYNAFPDPPPGTARRVGINFGAPASRLDAPSQVLWVEHPPLVGPTPEIPLEVEANGGEHWFRHHTAFIEAENGSHRWVVASGFEGEGAFRLTDLFADANPGALPSYTVRLHFAEPHAHVAPGERVFHVQIQGETVSRDYDVAARAGGAMRGTVLEAENVAPTASGALTVSLERAINSAHDPVLCGIEVLLKQ